MEEEGERRKEHQGDRGWDSAVLWKPKKGELLQRERPLVTNGAERPEKMRSKS